MEVEERGEGRSEREKMEDEGRKTVVHSPSSILRFPLSVFRWAPVLLWMAGIFHFSSRPNPLGSLPSSENGIDIGNLAHIGEYAGLAILLYRALEEHGSGGAGEQGRVTEGKPAHNPEPTHAPQPLCTSAQKAAVGPQRSAVVLAIALAYAILDELHQELVPGRGFGLTDIGYDLAGMMVALGLIWLRGRFLASKANARRPASGE